MDLNESNSVTFFHKDGEHIDVVKISVEDNGETYLYSDEPFSYSKVKEVIEKELDSPRAIPCKTCRGIVLIYIGDKPTWIEPICNACRIERRYREGGLPFGLKP